MDILYIARSQSIQNDIATIGQTIFSNAPSWMKMYEFR